MLTSLQVFFKEWFYGEFYSKTAAVQLNSLPIVSESVILALFDVCSCFGLRGMNQQRIDLLSLAGLGRRRMLQLAGGSVGLNLAGMWNARAGQAESDLVNVQERSSTPIRSCIIVFYYGGPDRKSVV